MEIEYYRVVQDERFTEVAYPLNLTKAQLLNHIIIAQEQDISSLQFYVDGQADFLAWLDDPYYMLSDELKCIWEQYQPSLVWRQVVLADQHTRTQRLCWLMACTEVINALSPLSEWNKDGTLKKMVLDERKLRGHKVCRVQGAGAPEVIVDLDVAECMLRFPLKGIQLQRLQIERDVLAGKD